MTNIGLSFLAAKYHLANSGTEFRDSINRGLALCICIAINNAHLAGKMTNAERDTCKKIIRERLDNSPSLIWWLKQNVPADQVHEITYDASYGDYGLIQKHRHEWLDQLIQEFLFSTVYDVEKQQSPKSR